MVTGIMLGIARVMGETAPVLLVVGFTSSINLNPFNGAQGSLPAFIFNEATQPYQHRRRPCLGRRPHPHPDHHAAQPRRPPDRLVEETRPQHDRRDPARDMSEGAGMVTATGKRHTEPTTTHPAATPAARAGDYTDEVTYTPVFPETLGHLRLLTVGPVELNLDGIVVRVTGTPCTCRRRSSNSSPFWSTTPGRS